MLVTLIVGFLVGAFYQNADDYVAMGLGKAGLTLPGEDKRLVTFALCLAAAAALLLLLGVKTYPVLLCLSAAIGIARKPVLARLTGNK